MKTLSEKRYANFEDSEHLTHFSYNEEDVKEAVEKFVYRLLELNKMYLLTPSNILNEKKKTFGSFE